MGKAFEMENELGVWNCISIAVLSISESFEELRDIGMQQAWEFHNCGFPETQCLLGNSGMWFCLINLYNCVDSLHEKH